MKQKVERLAIKARFERIPALRISKDKHLLAKASILRKKITIGAELLSQWKKGEIDENDVEVTLAHEIGHLIDFERGFSSVLFRYDAFVVLYLVLSVVLPRLFWFSYLTEPWIPPLMIFVIWACFLPWVLRRASCAIQLEADSKGAQLLTEEQFANSIVKRSKFHDSKGSGLIETWDLLLHVILFPSLNQRLRNLNFEIKESKIEIQRKEDKENQK